MEELREAVVQQQLVLHYHPIVELGTGRISGVEALVRWQHPRLGLLPPLSFVPLAEESGLVVELGEWVVRTGGSQAAAWAATGWPLDMFINVSPLQMGLPDFADRFFAVMAEAAVPAERIVLEVTESALMDTPHAADGLVRLHDSGIRLALDDFGTGYSSFSYLRRFPIDIIKIDRGFVAGLGRNPDDDAIVTSVVGLSTATGKTVVAEGVETEDQVVILQKLGVQSAQGFLWTRPLPAEQLVPWIAGFQLSRPSSAPVGSPRRRGRSQTTADGPEAERLLQLNAGGASLNTIAAALNGEGLRTSSGRRWHVTSVAQVIEQRRTPEPV